MVVVIPARYGSSRFPGKPLAVLAGKPLIQHVYERASEVPHIEQVLVATDDVRIRDRVEEFGGTVVMTDSAARTGTDRVAAVARDLQASVFINLQGDEIPLHTDLITDLIVGFQTEEVGMGTLKRRFHPPEDPRDPRYVKVVTDHQGQALYFSRAPIPVDRDRAWTHAAPSHHFLHLGVYIYTRSILLRMAELPSGHLENLEKLEQVRALEHGIPIRVWETAHSSLRIDCPEDLEKAPRL